jgi:hypothetical protein
VTSQYIEKYGQLPSFDAEWGVNWWAEQWQLGSPIPQPPDGVEIAWISDIYKDKMPLAVQECNDSKLTVAILNDEIIRTNKTVNYALYEPGRESQLVDRRLVAEASKPSVAPVTEDKGARPKPRFIHRQFGRPKSQFGRVIEWRKKNG